MGKDNGNRVAKHLEDDFVFRERVAEMDRLRRCGFTVKEIAGRFGMSDKNASRLLRYWAAWKGRENGNEDRAR